MDNEKAISISNFDSLINEAVNSQIFGGKIFSENTCAKDGYYCV
jgi:hypothetical protein